jgi:poly(A) polymerase
MLRLNSEDLFEWGHIYAHPKAYTCLQVIAARLTPEIRQTLLEKHKNRKEFLGPHIERITLKKPLVNAAILLQHGVQPGKHMGKLLKEAERMAINYNLHEPEKIIEKLKQMPIWPEN